MKRRDFISSVAGAAGLAGLAGGLSCDRRKDLGLNILIITGDDLSYRAIGANGCPVVGITPHIDRFAGQGMRFERAHANIAACQPSRATVMTGMYPHNNGAMGFDAVSEDVKVLTEYLHERGYIKAIMGKVKHYKPVDKFMWDSKMFAKFDLGHGRNPENYGIKAGEIFNIAIEQERPFCLLVNSHDAHRPFAGTPKEGRAFSHTFAQPPRQYQIGQVEVPGFLPDLPEIELDMAYYYSSVSRCDAAVGSTLDALDASGLADSTLVVFLSDHGMGFPFAKANCYTSSTHIPAIVRWPGVIPPGVDSEHFISGIDFLPTFLEAAKIPVPPNLDGRSLMPLLRGEKQEGRDRMYTMFQSNLAQDPLPMRGIQSREFSYIFNAWADGETRYVTALDDNRPLEAMERAALRGNEAIADRLNFLYFRTPEEFYDLRSDPDSLKNRIDDPSLKDEVAALKEEMLQTMRAIGDPLLEQYVARTSG